MKNIILLITIALFIGCEKDPVIQDIESNSVITYVLKSSDPTFIYYCEYIDPAYDVPQRVVISNIGETPWTRDVIAIGDLKQYHLYFRIYTYIVTDTLLYECANSGVCVIFLDSDFTQEIDALGKILVNGKDSAAVVAYIGGVPYPREDGLDWNNHTNIYIDEETYEIHADIRREQYDSDNPYKIYRPLRYDVLDENGECVGMGYLHDL